MKLKPFLKRASLVLGILLHVCCASDFHDVNAIDSAQSIASKTSSSRLPIVSVRANGNDGNVAKNTIDNDFETRWSALGYSGKYITYDLGSPKYLSKVRIAWYKGNKRKAFFKISVGNSRSTLRTVYNARRTGSSGKTNRFETYAFTKVKARFVRISCYGNSKSGWNSILETRILKPGSGGGSGGGTGNKPFAVLGLKNWKLNGLKGSPRRNTYLDKIPNLSSYSNPNWFFLRNKWTVFQVWAGSATSRGSGNPRMELRELTADGKNNIYWNGTTNTEHSMKWTVKVERLPSSGKVCFGQIHDKTDKFDDVIRVQCQGNANQTTGAVKFRINGYVTETLENGGKTIGKFNLGEVLHLELTYKKSIVTLYRLNGKGNRIKTLFRSKKVSAKQNYFKAGNYLQSMKGKSYKSSDYGRVLIRSIQVKH